MEHYATWINTTCQVDFKGNYVVTPDMIESYEDFCKILIEIRDLVVVALPEVLAAKDTWTYTHMINGDSEYPLDEIAMDWGTDPESGYYELLVFRITEYIELLETIINDIKNANYERAFLDNGLAVYVLQNGYKGIDVFDAITLILNL